MKKHLKKLRPLLLLGALFMLTNCSEELDVVTNSQQQNTSQRYKILTGEDAIKLKNNLVDNLKQNSNKGLFTIKRTIKNETMAKTTMSDIEGLIDFSRVLAIENESGITNYTFLLNHPDASDEKFYNLVLKSKGSASKIIMATYTMDPEFAKEFNQTGSLLNFTGTINYDLVTYDSDFPCEEVPDAPVNAIGGGGSGPMYMDPHLPYNQELVNVIYASFSFTKTFEIEVGPINGGIPPVNNLPGAPGGSIPTNPPTGSDIYSTRTFQVASEPDGPCNEDDEIGVFPNNSGQQRKKNCEELKKMSSDNKLKTALTDLKTKTSESIEYGYGIKKNTTGYDSPQPATAVPSNPSQINMSNFIGGDYIGGFHTHPDPFTGNFPMFSASDLSYLFFVASKHNTGGQPKNYNEYFLTLTSTHGTYAIKIEDHMKLNALINSGNFSKLNKQLFNLYNTRNPEDGIDDFMLDFLNTLKKYDAGISLYEADSNFNWSKIEMNDDPLTSAYSLKSIPCN